MTIDHSADDDPCRQARPGGERKQRIPGNKGNKGKTHRRKRATSRAATRIRGGENVSGGARGNGAPPSSQRWLRTKLPALLRA